jgi:hypothetical protein
MENSPTWDAISRSANHETPYEEPEGTQDPGSTTTATGSYPAPDNPSLDPDILLQ